MLVRWDFIPAQILLNGAAILKDFCRAGISSAEAITKLYLMKA